MALPAIPDDRSYLTVPQLEDLEKQKSSLLRQIDNPTIEDKGALRRRILDINRALAEDSPPVLTGVDFDAAVKEVRRLKEKISKGMLSREEMMRCPRGAPDIEAKFQIEQGPDICKWKNGTRITNPGNSDPGLCDIDQLRPERSSLPMTDAQIPRKRPFIDMAGVPAENWDETFGPSPEGETLAERVERFEAAAREARAKLAEQGEQLPSRKPGPRGPDVSKAGAATPA